MDPLSALGIAAAVVQFVDIGGKLLIKGWEKYQQMQQGAPDDEELEKLARDVKEAFEELSLRISGIQQVSINMRDSQPTPAQAHLLQRLSRCNGLLGELDEVKSQLKIPNSRAVNTEIHQTSHAHRGLALVFRSNFREDNCEDCQKRRAEEKQEYEKNARMIEGLTEQLETLRSSVTESVIYCLWEDSRRSQHWELHFNNQLNKAIELLERAQGSTSEETGSGDDRHRHHISQVDEEAFTLRAMQPLIQPGNGPLSLKQLADDLVRSLRSESETRHSVRDELIDRLWKPDWKLDVSLAGDSLANVDITTVANGIAAGVEFENIHLREIAIPKSFDTTYSWIFCDEPPADRNIPGWHSFPKWLQDGVHKVYWITGKPGCGKSTIMKLILQHETLLVALSQTPGSLRPLLVKYYAWHPGSTLQKSLDGLKRTIIYQALHEWPELAPSVTPRRWAFCQVLRSTSGLPTWTSWGIEESMAALLSLCGKTIKLALFIDGLDEFDTPPTEIVDFIRHITERCGSGPKVCAASRPWREFQDEFSRGPMLQMDLHTQQDMRSFIDKNFANNHGFIEQQQLYPQAATQLLDDILERANGVFLWVSIVTQLLLDLLSEGYSIPRAREILESLPPDISSLYDTIWDTIRSQHLPDASFMMQVLRAADGPLPWFTMWLIEALRSDDVSKCAPLDINMLPTHSDWKIAAMKSLQRKLAAWTKCILEVRSECYDGYVDFTHRTARDWALKPDRWQLICSLSSDDFDPHLAILQAETVILSDSNYIDRHHPMVIYLWDILAKALSTAGEVKDTPSNRKQLVNCLTSLNTHVWRLSQELDCAGLEKRSDLETNCWYHSKNFRLLKVENTMLGLAAQFAVLPYIKAVLPTDRRPLFYRDDVLGLLENAIFGYAYFYKEPSQDELPPLIPIERRLATVEYLLKQGLYQSRVHARSGTCSLQDAIKEASATDPEYYAEVTKYLDRMGLTSNTKGSYLRIRSRVLDYLGYETSKANLTYW
ncbi:hypothetical protein TgHK011_006868 [Trichoderma gracile]|nr:hypothetical protein TgHK011_006868 [Trichoderma gracile]